MTPQDRRRSLVAILVSAVAIGLTVSMATPLITLLLERAEYGSVAAGALAAVYALAIVACGPFVPRLMHRIAPVPLLCGGLALTAAALALFPLAGALALWVLLRAGTGAGSAVGWIVSETWISRLATERDRGRIVGLYSMVVGLGFAGGPAILAVTGSQGALPFLVAAGVLAAAMLPVLWARRVAPDLSRAPMPGGLAAPLRAAKLAVALGLLSGFAESSFFALFPLYGLSAGFGERATVGLIAAFGVGTVALQPACGWLADRVDRARLTDATVLAALACVLLLPLTQDSWAIWPTMVLWGGTVAGFYTLGLIVLGQTFAGGDLASANAAYIMTYTGGMVIGPLAGGLAMAIWDPYGLLAVATLSYLLFLAARLRVKMPAPVKATAD
jgi:MFS family permease